MPEGYRWGNKENAILNGQKPADISGLEEIAAANLDHEQWDGLTIWEVVDGFAKLKERPKPFIVPWRDDPDG